MSYQPVFKVSDQVRRHLQDIERLRSTITSGHILPAVEASVLNQSIALPRLKATRLISTRSEQSSPPTES